MNAKFENTAKGTSFLNDPVAENFSAAPHSRAIQDLGSAGALSGLFGWKAKVKPHCFHQIDEEEGERRRPDKRLGETFNLKNFFEF